MAKDIAISGDEYNGIDPVYYVAYRISDDAYLNGGSFESYNAAHWTGYATLLALDTTTDDFVADFPSVDSGDYYVRIYRQDGGSPATTDDVLAEDIFCYVNVPAFTTAGTLAAQMALDASVWINIAEFAESVTYNAWQNDNTFISTSLDALVIRDLPAVVREDGKTLADDIDIYLFNDAARGKTAINKGRDTITVSGRYGGAAANHVVTAVLGSDAGIWHLRLR